MESIIIGALILVCLCLIVILFISKSKNDKLIVQHLDDISKYKSDIDQLNSDIQKEVDKGKTLDEHLSKYQKIIDQEAEIKRLQEAFQVQKKKEIEAVKLKIDEISEQLKNKQTKFERYKTSEIDRLKSEAEQINRQIDDLNDKKSELTKQNRKLLDDATLQAKAIIDTANERAEDIAGEALVAKRDADHYEKAIQAMKNTIKGYGEEYLIPGHTLLDDMAEEYSHKDAGVELKQARERVRLMVKNSTAADCKYVAAQQRNDAIHLVLDAFNGKTSTILSKVKKDNYGKLKQELNDAYHLVNKNGKVFRDAVILPEYLEARQNELELAVKVHELQFQEREEQKRIKQEMREEEKARKEYERAIKEAEKEEKLLQKAMDKIRAEIQTASEEQQRMYEKQLEELQGKLKEAEEKNQRAISMAQQTKQGHVYVISNIGSFGEDIYKIGLTRRLEPHIRVKELGDASVPFEFDIHAMIFSDDAPALEKALHHIFHDQQVNKVNPRKEFFSVKIADIKKIIQDKGVEAKWTLIAEAREYRESLAMTTALERAVN